MQDLVKATWEILRRLASVTVDDVLGLTADNRVGGDGLFER